jgi:hypothetical protein
LITKVVVCPAAEGVEEKSSFSTTPLIVGVASTGGG